MSIKLGPLVGSTTHNEAKIWVQTDTPARLECRVYTDQEGSSQIPDSPFVFETKQVNGCTGLVTVALPQDYKKYYYSVIETGGTGTTPIPRIYSFRTFPARDKKIESFSFGLISCNRPRDVKNGQEPGLRDMWRHLYNEMSGQDAAFLLAVGDQVYADHNKDNAWQKSLKGDPGKTPLERYREIYKTHWSFREMHSVIRNFPTFMIWDDHEITNGWGSSNKHAGEKEQEIFRVAKKVYEEFQHSHNPPALSHPRGHTLTQGHTPYYYAFRYGPAAFLFLDLRGNRRCWEKQLLGPDQKAALEHWFESKEARDSKILFVISSVPMIHVRRWIARAISWIKTDIADQWSSKYYYKDRRFILKLLFDRYVEGGKRKAVVLGGDVHVGTVAKATDSLTGQSIYQFTSSPISNEAQPFFDRILTKFGNKFDFHLDEEDERTVHVEIEGKDKRFHERNFGIITVDFGSPLKATARMYEEFKGESEEIQV
ncbi:MAG: alkaline phosphatase D family protein [Candidatus Bathyanammoxibius sp.]